MKNLLVVLPYCQKDHAEALRLLKWIQELDATNGHSILLVADDAVSVEHKKAIDALGKEVFSYAETITLKCPAPVGTNYHVPAAFMFAKAMGHIDACFKYNFLWLEPDAVPLKSGWLDVLADAYYNSPKRFLGPFFNPNQPNLPKTVMFATAIYPNCANEELKQFCDGKEQAFDMAFSDYVVPRAQNTPLIFHAFGAPNDPPTFKEVKMPGDGPNVGTLEVLPKEAVLFHRNKDGSLIELLRKRGVTNAFGPLQDALVGEPLSPPQPPKRRPGRPPKQVPVESTMT